MRLFRWTAVAAVPVIALGAIAATAPSRARDAKVERIQAHFDSVLVELDLNTPGSLTLDQRMHRRRLIAELERYRDVGVFPHNYDFPDRPTPYFVDRKTGTLCAVANLLAFSGRRDIVDRVAASNNNVWVAQLAGDTAFTAWLGRNGLTLDEAERIQVPYVITPSAELTPAQKSRNKVFAYVAPTAFVGALTTSILNAKANADGHRTAVSKVGIVTGIGAVAAGTLMLTKHGESNAFYSVGAVSAAAGGTSLALATRAMRRHSATMSPVITAGNHPSAGVSLSLTY